MYLNKLRLNYNYCLSFFRLIMSDDFEMSVKTNDSYSYVLTDEEKLESQNACDVTFADTPVEAFTNEEIFSIDSEPEADDYDEDDVASRDLRTPADLNTYAEHLSGSTVSLEVDFDCGASTTSSSVAGKAQKYVVKKKTSAGKKFRTCFFLTCMVVVLASVTISIIVGYYGK